MPVRLRFPGGGLSDAYQLLRGVRQGCPLSAIMIFIDTLFDDWVDDRGRSLAATVPCVGSTSLSVTVPGLLFAATGSASDDASGVDLRQSTRLGVQVGVCTSVHLPLRLV
jgi:hypothetical protein